MSQFWFPQLTAIDGFNLFKVFIKVKNKGYRAKMIHSFKFSLTSDKIFISLLTLDNWIFVVSLQSPTFRQLGRVDKENTRHC
jgi:hypothetical protein